MSRITIGNGFTVDEATFERYWLLISDNPAAQRYRSEGESRALADERQRLHDGVVKSAGFDPELRFKSRGEQMRSGFWDFNETLEDYIANRLFKEECIGALNRRVLGD